VNEMLEWAKALSPEERLAFIRRVEGPPMRKLEGEEYNQVWTLLKLSGGPASTSNNQHSWTDIYIIGSQEDYTEYHVTWFTPIAENPEISVILKEEKNVQAFAG
jgi:hypothetical protein